MDQDKNHTVQQEDENGAGMSLSSKQIVKSRWGGPKRKKIDHSKKEKKISADCMIHKVQRFLYAFVVIMVIPFRDTNYL